MKRKRTPSIPQDVRGSSNNNPSMSKYEYMVLLPNGTHVTLTFEDPNTGMSVGEFVRFVKRKVDADGYVGTPSRRVLWGSHVTLEDNMGASLLSGHIIPPTPNPINTPITVILQDGGENSLHTHQDMWDVTPEAQILVELPEEYTLETALADLIDNSLQAVWANGPGERRLISVNIQDRQISIFDSGQGMDGSEEHSIAKWGRMGCSNHRSVRGLAIGGKPPFLKPFFGMYGYGGLTASMHLGGLVTVSSKTKAAKKVITLNLEKETLVRKSRDDRIWRIAGDIREISQEEREMSPHGSFTKVHIVDLKSKYWNEEQLKCMLKDIYFPYIQNDGSDSVLTSTPVEFEVNGVNLTEVEGGEVVTTNLTACNGPPFVLDVTLNKGPTMNGHTSVRGTDDNANARLSCFYFPINKGKESIDSILEKLEAEKSPVSESFETFCRVSIRRLGRLLPDARWGRLPFMEPKRKRFENSRIPQQCYKRVKCLLETDAGFAPTTSKTDLAHKHPFTLALKNLGRKTEQSDNSINMTIERDGKPISISQLEKEYHEWLKAMHESYDEEVECTGEQAIMILNPTNGKDLGISNNVIRVLTQIRKNGVLWKRNQKVKIQKGFLEIKKDIYATIEYILCEGLEGDPGEARMICRPIDFSEDEGSKVVLDCGLASFYLGNSKSVPLDFVSSGKCQSVDDESWRRYEDKKHLKDPAFIDVLNTKQVQCFGLDKGFPKGEIFQAGFEFPREIIAVVRPHSFAADSNLKGFDGSDKKYIIKESMEMKMDIIVSQGKEPVEEHKNEEVKYSTQTKTSSCNGVEGLYVFPMEGCRLLEMFRKAGRYKFLFSLVKSPYPTLSATETEIVVEPSDRVGRWKISTQQPEAEAEESKRLKARLGSELGPLYISCYDTYSNQMAFKSYPQLEVQVQLNGKPVGIKIEKASGTLIKDKMYLQISAIVLGRGNLSLLRPSFEAYLKVGSRESCFTELPFIVLPGEMNTAKLLNEEDLNLDNCLHPGDIIHSFRLQILDAYGNPVEKGRKINVKLQGLEFQDDNMDHREVDEQGCINFGGLLKVTGGYGSKGSVLVSSDKRILLNKEFQLLCRQLRVISEIPLECCCGCSLENIVLGIFDGHGDIDEKFDGRQHTLTIDLHTEKFVQYTFKEGKCIVPRIQIPEAEGVFEFKAFHSLHLELVVDIKVNVLPKPPLEMVSLSGQFLDEGAVCHPLEDEAISLANSNTPMVAMDEIKFCIESFVKDIMKWEEELRRLGIKVKQREDIVDDKKSKLNIVNRRLITLKRDLDKCCHPSNGGTLGISNQATHDEDETLTEIKKQGSSAAALWVELKERFHQICNVPLLKDVVGVVALLGKVESDVLNRALCEFLGKENMLGIVCKSHAGLEALESYNEKGELLTRAGIHGLASAQNIKLDGRFRVLCLEDIDPYTGRVDFKDPQRRLDIDDPRRSNGELPEGYLGYAVNMIILDPEDANFVASTSATGLRGTLFFHLFRYLQVYQTRHHMNRAMPFIKDGAVSLDGGMIRQKGTFECGNRVNLCLRFPVTSGETVPSDFHLKLETEERIRQVYEEKKVLEKELDEACVRLEQTKRKFNQKKRELNSRESQKSSFLENLESQGFLLENNQSSE